MENLNLEIEDFGRINKAKIEIGKINVVGGVNASGKSTASKLLYCFLKAMSLNRQEYIIKAILPTLNNYVNIMKAPSRYAKIVSEEDKFCFDSDFEEILSAYADAKKTFDKLGHGYFESPFDEFMFEMDEYLEKFLGILVFNDMDSYSPVVKSLFEVESLLDFEGTSTFYNDSFKSSVFYAFDEGFYDDNYERESRLKSKDIPYDDFDKKFVYLTEGSLKFLNDVFYIDSISTFDFDYYNLYTIKGHLNQLLDDLKNEEGFVSVFGSDDKSFTKEKNTIKDSLSEEVIQVMDGLNEKITNIIGGKINRNPEIVFKNKRFGKEIFEFQPINSDSTFKLNISSGIQQIAIIQTLLSNYKLQPGSFLIIDEPEINLHPEWQFKFAEILVLLAKELDITVYLNSHSPMFIESIDAFSEYYDIQDEVNYYLTEESEVEGKYNFTRIPPDKLYLIYKNLGNIYDLIDELRLIKRLGD